MNSAAQRAIGSFTDGKGNPADLLQIPRTSSGDKGNWWLTERGRRFAIKHFPCLTPYLQDRQGTLYPINSALFYDIIHRKHLPSDYTGWLSVLESPQ